MKKILLGILLLVLSANYGLTQKQSDKIQLVVISTSYGDMTIYLYEKTAKHRENFLKLVREGFYDSTTFHRVIDRFMIQGGDINSKDNDPNNDGQGSIGYTIPAEFFPEYFHKKGAVAGARLGDNVNPNRESSGSQFYIVQGQTFDKESVKRMGLSLYSQDYMSKPEAMWIRKIDWAKMQKEHPDSLTHYQQKIQEVISKGYEKEKEKYDFSPEALEAYSTIGGTPHLDKGYTVFGEVIKGLDVVDKIAACEKVENTDRPAKPIYMKARIVELTPKELKEQYNFTPNPR